MSKYGSWYGRVVWLGVFANLALAVPAVVLPVELLALIGVRPTGDPVWTAFAAWLLILLSLFYIPAARDPDRHRASAWLTIVARAAGVVFFTVLYPGVYPAFALIDGVFFVLQLPLLVLHVRARASAQG